MIGAGGRTGGHVENDVESSGFNACHRQHREYTHSGPQRTMVSHEASAHCLCSAMSAQTAVGEALALARAVAAAGRGGGGPKV